MVLKLVLVAVAFGAVVASTDNGRFTFAILGDRTGGAVEGVYEEAWQETDLDRPAFVLSVGDTIQGGNDRTLENEWEVFHAIVAPYRRFKTFFTPGNHDVWSEASARAYVENTKRPLHYGFDFKQVHVTVLDNSRQEDISNDEMAFLEKDLEAHKSQPVKFIVSHRPSWILQTVLGNPAFRLHQMARRYGVKYVLAGHIHQMLHFNVDGITYLCMASSGGHLRESKSYERGWFYEHTAVTVDGNKVSFEIKELGPPFGKGRITSPDDWGAAGLVRR